MGGLVRDVAQMIMYGILLQGSSHWLPNPYPHIWNCLFRTQNLKVWLEQSKMLRLLWWNNCQGTIVSREKMTMNCHCIESGSMRLLIKSYLHWFPYQSNEKCCHDVVLYAHLFSYWRIANPFCKEVESCCPKKILKSLPRKLQRLCTLCLLIVYLQSFLMTRSSTQTPRN